MPMFLNHLAANVTEVTLANGTQILFSYATPVAATLTDGTKIRSLTRYSRTTSKHLSVHGYSNAKRVPQAVIDSLTK